jgi:hypothetical protein
MLIRLLKGLNQFICLAGDSQIDEDDKIDLSFAQILFGHR